MAVGPEAPAGFLERLAHDRVEEGFAVLEMSGRLVEDQAAARAFLDEQELTVAFDDGRDRHVGLPDHAVIIGRYGDGF